MKLEELFARVLSIPLSFITDDLSPKSQKNWNSLRHLQLVTTIENTYGIRFKASEIVALNSFADIRKNLQQKGVEV